MAICNGCNEEIVGFATNGFCEDCLCTECGSTLASADERTTRICENCEEERI